MSKHSIIRSRNEIDDEPEAILVGINISGARDPVIGFGNVRKRDLMKKEERRNHPDIYENNFSTETVCMSVNPSCLFPHF